MMIKKNINKFWPIALLVVYVTFYFAMSRVEDRQTTKGSYGGLSGERYSRHFNTQTQCLTFLPLLWIERVFRGGRLDVTIESGEYKRIIWVF
jgi:hypothetical protein